MGYFGNNVWRIVGVLNGGYNTRGRDSWYGDVSIYASLTNSTNVNFLKAQGISFDNPRTAAAALAGSGVSGSTRDALGPSAVPEPGSVAAAGVVALGLLARRRRRRA
jgi:hypothetical protein